MGPAGEDGTVFQYIFQTWLPGSEFELAQRLHFDLLGEKYSNEDLQSEEEFWIPVKSKPWWQ